MKTLIKGRATDLSLQGAPGQSSLQHHYSSLPGYYPEAGYDTSFFQLRFQTLQRHYHIMISCTFLPFLVFLILTCISSRQYFKLFLNYLIFFFMVKSSRFIRVNYCKLTFLIQNFTAMLFQIIWLPLRRSSIMFCIM